MNILMKGVSNASPMADCQIELAMAFEFPVGAKAVWLP